jgi:hypothetical protein
MLPERSAKNATDVLACEPTAEKTPVFMVGRAKASTRNTKINVRITSSNIWRSLSRRILVFCKLRRKTNDENSMVRTFCRFNR